jgi:hypothetical protein
VLTLSLADIKRTTFAYGSLLFDLPERPRTRGECGNERPCPWVGCRYHLYLEVRRRGGILFPWADLEPWELPETCALDLTEKYPDGMTLEHVGEIFNQTRERIRQVELMCLQKIMKRKDYCPHE